MRRSACGMVNCGWEAWWRWTFYSLTSLHSGAREADMFREEVVYSEEVR